MNDWRTVCVRVTGNRRLSADCLRRKEATSQSDDHMPGKVRKMAQRRTAAEYSAFERELLSKFGGGSPDSMQMIYSTCDELNAGRSGCLKDMLSQHCFEMLTKYAFNLIRK